MRRTLALTALAFLALGAGKADRYARVLPAIEMVESSGRADAVGDGGKAVGILQIHPIMVEDVNRILGQDRYTLADRLDPAKSREMFRVYSDHYARCGDAEKVARNWNGGPRGHRKAATVAYWRKVERAMGGAK
jgi:hypothetical protein